GIAVGRAAAGAPAGVSLQHAIEFNTVSRAQQDLPCMLKSVLPVVASDCVCYSAWESVGPPPTGELRRRILDDLAFIRVYPGMGLRPLMIGEYGDTQADAVTRVRIEATTFLEAGIPTAAYWEILDDALGIVRADPARTRTALWPMFRILLGGPIAL